MTLVAIEHIRYWGIGVPEAFSQALFDLGEEILRLLHDPRRESISQKRKIEQKRSEGRQDKMERMKRDKKITGYDKNWSEAGGSGGGYGKTSEGGKRYG